jgi:hypothetical protein
MVKLPISKYAIYEDDYDDLPAEVMEEIVREYDELGDADWKEKQKFLNKIMDEYYGTETAAWAEEKRDDLQYELAMQIENLLDSMVREEATKNYPDEDMQKLYYENVTDRIFLNELSGDISWNLLDRGGDEREEAKKALDEAMQAFQSDILLSMQRDIKDKIDTDVLTETVRFMQTPEEMERVETPTEPKELEKVPSDRGLGSISCRSPNMTRRAVMQSPLIRALKGDGLKEVKKTLSEFINILPLGVRPEDELNMTQDDYRRFTHYIMNGDLEGAREIYGVEKDTKDNNLSEEVKEHKEEPTPGKEWHEMSREEKDEYLDWWDKLSPEERDQLDRRAKKITRKVKRGGKMLTELFKLAQTLDKKGEYGLASEVDEIIKELSQRAGLTPEEMVSLANDLDTEGEIELADKLDAVIAKKKSKD